jgi:hypothetical protein
MAQKQGTPLSSIAGFPEAVRQRLAELWIVTAEELVGAAVIENGPQGLADHAGVPLDQMVQIIEQAVAALPPGVSFAPGDIQPFGLGSLDEPDEAGEPDEAVSFAPLPGQVDLRARMPPVRNQQARGTCVAHACAAVREYMLGEKSVEGDLSEQFLYWACKERDGYPGSGTWIHIAMQALKETGVCVEAAWPYNPAPIPDNEGQGPPPAEAEELAKAHRIKGSLRLPTRGIYTLRWRLSQGKPIAFAVPVFTYWFAAPARTTGDIRMPLTTDRREGGHAMCIVGYEDDPEVPGGGSFLVRNSWGTGWASQSAAEPGHCRIPYEYIRLYCSAAYTASVSAVTPPGRRK